MFGHPKNVEYDRNMKVFDWKDRDAWRLEKEEIELIGIFTGMVAIALILAALL